MRTDVRAAIALLLLAEATLFFTFLFTIGPIATPPLLVPLILVIVLSTALYFGQEWAKWVLLAPIVFRVRQLVLVLAAAWGVGRAGTALFLTVILLTELAGTFVLFERYLARWHPLARRRAEALSPGAR